MFQSMKNVMAKDSDWRCQADSRMLLRFACNVVGHQLPKQSSHVCQAKDRALRCVYTAIVFRQQAEFTKAGILDCVPAFGALDAPLVCQLGCLYLVQHFIIACARLKAAATTQELFVVYASIELQKVAAACTCPGDQPCPQGFEY